VKTIKIFLIFIVFLAIGAYIYQYSFSEGKPANIHLKSGGIIRGFVEKEAQDGIIIETGYGKVAISNNDIESIEYPDTSREKEELEAQILEVSPEKYDTKEAALMKKREEEAYHKRMKDIAEMEREAARRRRLERGIDIEVKDRSKILVGALINGHVETNLQLDTGASLVAISPSVARILGIDYLRKQKIDIQLAFGKKVPGVLVMLDSIKVGYVEVRNVKAVVVLSDQIPEGQDGFLGMSFLRYFDIKINPRDKKMYLLKREMFQKDI